MELLILILSIMAAVLVSSFLSRFIPRISTPLVQIALGLVIALLPMFPPLRLDPELFMVLFIAPLLYYEAHTINKAELAKTLKLSLSLAIGLAAFTMLMVGVLLHAVWPMYPLAAALALGAALGPTDAVAVSSIGQDADLSSGQRSILSGESLFNDATGVIGFQFAILAAVTGAFSPTSAISSFVIAFVGGIAFGAVMGFTSNWIFETARRLGWESMTTRILMELFLPFLIYLVAENWLDVSGVLAVVTTGLLARFDHTGLGPNTSKTNIVSTSVWKVLSFSLNGAVFVILGMLLPGALVATWSDKKVSNLTLLATIALVACTVIIVRFVWVTGVLFFATNPETGKHVPMNARRLRSAAVMTLGGPKGTITLSLALTTPYLLASGDPFPMRNELIFVAAGVIIVTLLLANFGLPLLAPAKNEGPETSKVEKSIEVLRRTVRELSAHTDECNRLAVQHVITLYNQRIARLKTQIGLYNPREPQALQLQTLQWEQTYMENKLEEIQEEGKQQEEPTDSSSESSEAGAATDEELAYSQDSREKAAEQILEHITNSLAHLDEGSEVKWHIHIAMRRAQGLIRHLIHRLRHVTPKVSENEVFLASRDLQAELNHHVVEQLYAELGKGRFKTEDLLTTIINHQLIESSAEGKTEFGEASEMRDSVEEVKREGYATELSVIQDMVEAGEISRSWARDLRRNVYVMQVDNDSVL
ncbi:sodium:proton antiporter [Bombiscardovia apis]|uniref:Sodium:proton antiporter n=1 Tax=Bombiscardovia apis TaxID=2932182 RepID=A0ABN6SEC5_9BIFI|nr:sodium:proton antiporter [Bombiscardovia apis]BDR53978.1 sodium:proton antiporter [Bombiscardovia apis]